MTTIASTTVERKSFAKRLRALCDLLDVPMDQGPMEGEPDCLGMLLADMEAETDCGRKQCNYYRFYLSLGPADLTHEGYHAAEAHCLEAQDTYSGHLKRCSVKTERPCRTCKALDAEASAWEKRIRA